MKYKSERNIFVSYMVHEEENNISSIRCGWVSGDPVYIKYHDEEWGIPEHNSLCLFEMLCLEGQQAGLSWITVLKKRDSYRKHFYNFDPYKISKLKDTDVNELVQDPGIIRHKKKIEALINNSKCFIKMERDGVDFAEFIWSFVDNKPIINFWKDIKEIPKNTPISTVLSKALKQKGFKYVGDTICYAFMQACGLVDDHIQDCICRKKKVENPKQLN